MALGSLLSLSSLRLREILKKRIVLGVGQVISWNAKLSYLFFHAFSRPLHVLKPLSSFDMIVFHRQI